MPHELKFPPPKSVQPQDRVSDVSQLFRRITGDEKEPAAIAAPTAAAQVASEAVVKGSKLTARLPAGVHHRLRVHAAMEGKTIEDFVIELLDAQLPRGLGEGT
jgi:hypothetical protein